MAGAIDTSKTYILTNRFNGPGLVLAVSNQPGNGSSPLPTLAMVNATDGDPNGQWFLTRVNGDQPGIFYRVHAAALGISQAVDVVNDGGAVTSSRLEMAPANSNSGQAWRFDQWSDDKSDGFRLSNKFTGPDMHLDVTADSAMDAILSGGDFNGQHWTLASAAGASPLQDSGDMEGSGQMLSTGGIIGFSVVAALGLGLLIFGGLYWSWRTRTRRRNARSAAELDPEAMDRKSSVQSFESNGSHSLHRLQTAPPPPNPNPNPRTETVSPASTYQQGTINLPWSNTGLSDNAPTVETVQSLDSVAELPDRSY